MSNYTSQPSWNTARCNRLLRPIASRIVLLKKYRSQLAQQAGLLFKEESIQLGNKRSHLQTNIIKHVKEEPVWAPSPARRRRIKRQYGMKTSSSEEAGSTHEKHSSQSSTKPSIQLSISTPAILRYSARPDMIDSSSQDTQLNESKEEPSKQPQFIRYHRNKTIRNDPIEHNFNLALTQTLKKTLPAAQWVLVEGIFNAFETLLKATTPRPPEEVGTRSLLSSCLRKVPEYIFAEEKWQREQDPDDHTDLSSQIYDNLEMVHSNWGSNMSPFEEVVRAHGVKLLGNAISEGIICPTMAHCLVALCIRALAPDEAEILLDHLLARYGSFPSPINIESNFFDIKGIKTLHLFAEKTSRYGYQYRKMDELLRNGSLPLGWMATTHMKLFWSRLVESISNNDANSCDSIRLANTVLSLSCSRVGPILAPEECALDIALQNTISRLMLFLIAIDYTRQTTSLIPISSNQHTAIQQLIFSMATVADINQVTSSRNPKRANCRIEQNVICAKALLAYLFMDGTRSSHSESDGNIHRQTAVVKSLARIVYELPPNLKRRENLSSFICAIARCCNRAEKGSGQRCVTSFVCNLSAVIDSCSKSFHAFSDRKLKQILVDVAQEFAEQAGKQDLFDWAATIETRLLGHSDLFVPKLSQTPKHTSKAAPSGFRWEEGISEWVARTPALFEEEKSASSFTVAVGEEADDELSGLTQSPSVIKSSRILEDRTNRVTKRKRKSVTGKTLPLFKKRKSARESYGKKKGKVSLSPMREHGSDDDELSFI
ncbi:MAG: hypothetical protein M1834_000801 [Cirrosporium novae-zelandiae]|nr:MAG: hypothetical protein M1834_000801 [Cirrosporium novae-zelandiae]